MGNLRYKMLCCWVCLGAASNAWASVISFKQNAPTPIIGGTYLGMEDTMLISNGLDAQFSEDDNFGTRNDFAIGSVALGPTIGGQRAPRNTLVRYNVSALTGQYISINSVTLRLYTKDPGAGANTAQMYRMQNANSGWVEGNDCCADGFSAEDIGGSTYNFRVQGASSFTGTPWAGSDGADMLGTDIGLTPLATTPLTGAEISGSAFDLVIGNSAIATTLINDWIAGPNAGLLLKTLDQANALQYVYYSSEETVVASAFEPELIVDYTPIPEPATLLTLLFVGFLSRRRTR